MKKENIQEASALYIKASGAAQSVQEVGSLEKVIADFEAIASKDSPLKGPASLRVAGIANVRGQYNKAAALYKTLQNNQDLDIAIRDYAALMRIAAAARSAKLTNHELLKLIDDSKINIFKDSANLLRASILIDDAKYEEARQILDDLKAHGKMKEIADILLIQTVQAQ
ncbi:MAG: hypothetical protein O3C05_01860 [Proteobacteria bacterium]|nr:hypothetical protein [Pseudomonadota bacterium]